MRIKLINTAFSETGNNDPGTIHYSVTIDGHTEWSEIKPLPTVRDAIYSWLEKRGASRAYSANCGFIRIMPPPGRTISLPLFTYCKTPDGMYRLFIKYEVDADINPAAGFETASYILDRPVAKASFEQEQICETLYIFIKNL